MMKYFLLTLTYITFLIQDFYIEFCQKYSTNSVFNTLSGQKKKKSQALIFSRTTFGTNDSLHSFWHWLYQIVQLLDTYFGHNNINFSARLTSEEGRFELLPNDFSMTAHIFSMGLKSGLWGGQFKCSTESSCSWNQFLTMGARWIRALSSWKTPSPSRKK